MRGLVSNNFGAPDPVRKALLFTSGLAIVAGGALAWSSDRGQATSDNRITPLTTLPEERAPKDNASRSLSEIPAPDDVDTSGSLKGDATSQATTNVTVNGQRIPLPSDGHLHKTIRSDGSLTTIDVRVHSSSRTQPGGAQVP
jgi:hypothetical protein